MRVDRLAVSSIPRLLFRIPLGVGWTSPTLNTSLQISASRGRSSLFFFNVGRSSFAACHCESLSRVLISHVYGSIM